MPGWPEAAQASLTQLDGELATLSQPFMLSGAQLHAAPLEEVGFRLGLGGLFCALQLAWVRAASHSHFSWLCL